ncbi:MAG TPA: TRAP transporter TatT component family protein [Kofleriaceae bacterium]|nr:TRAP transporter TatT component family protein [Kofleriaceae bacterium]
MHARLAFAAVLVAGLSACDIGRITVGTTAHILVRAQPALNQESDYQLAHDAIPGTLKTIEGFWVVDPDNAELLGLLTEGYCQYGTAFVEDDWEIAKFAKKLDEIEYHNARATHIFTRCLNYALRQLGGRWQIDLFGAPDGVARLAHDTEADKRDALMWAALALGSIINHNLSRVELLAYQPAVKLMLDRVLEIDKSHPPSRPDYAALPHIAFAMLYSATGVQTGGKPAEARAEFEEALRLTASKEFPKGRLLLARTLMGYRLGLVNNDQKFFHDQLKDVLETPPSVWPEQRLANEVAHRRARRYLSHEKELFQ